ncbi:RDD family protein [Natronosalvus halobius]|uniref:RDD family protein n=1 Tax=Natronosalvus halobius TaxID=2953746 RepID=UPI00209E7261|nr:RDD family protein [Natronosalvus halobius]USZ70259.1 RDD family protein [Natronosalvus halobius]
MNRKRHNYAGVLERGLALLLDGIIIFVLLLAVLLPLIFLLQPASPESTEALGGFVGLVGSAVYYVGTEARWGATGGKMAIGLRVVNRHGEQCSTGDAVIRNITKIIGAGTLLAVIVAILLIISSEDNQRLGDMMAETVVVRE